MDETCIKVRGQWKYLYRAIDTAGQTIDFLLTAKHDAAAALRFFSKAPSPRRTRPMLEFKSFRRAQAILAGIELST
ncbi:transposase-like protein [Yokenella regensburgei]|nr:transposase-like protein [Yokenella regensburgei]